MVLKHPSQGDCSAIAMSGLANASTEMDLKDMLELELHRIFILMRSWSLSRELNQMNVLSLEPDIVQGLIRKVRDEIGLTAIM